MFNKTYNYQKPKIVITPETDSNVVNRKQFKITSVHTKTPIEKDNYIPLVSPQLSAYAKPGERMKLQMKFIRAKQNKSVNHDDTQQYFTKPNNDDQYVSDDQVLQIVSSHMKSESQMSQYQRKTKRKPKTHRNIFSLFFEESMELAQLREKMRPRSHFITDSRNRTYSGFIDGMIQQGKRCRLLKRFADII